MHRLRCGGVQGGSLRTRQDGHSGLLLKTAPEGGSGGGEAQTGQEAPCPRLAQGRVHRAPSTNGRPGGSSFLRGAHPCPPPQGQDSEWGGIASQPAELWVPPWLLRLRDQARVYPGIPGPKVTP